MNSINFARTHKYRSRGGTLLDLLIACSICGLLIQIGLAAVHASREAARRSLCVNNLRQLALGVQGHLAAHDHFPAGGWSWEWIGDANRGAKHEQPGGWIYNLLPYIGESTVHDHGLGNANGPLRDKMAEMESLVVSTLYCPTRRTPRPFPRDWGQETLNSRPTREHAKTDYAANGGDVYVNLGRGPRSYAEADQPGFPWQQGNNIAFASGILFPHSYTPRAAVVDGMSKTYLFGEKYLNRHNYDNGRDDGDDFCAYQGDDMDITRWTLPLVSDPSKELYDHPNQPRSDADDVFSAYAFGSAHSIGWNAAYCDGSVKLLSYHLDSRIHQQHGNIADETFMDTTE